MLFIASTHLYIYWLLQNSTDTNFLPRNYLLLSYSSEVRGKNQQKKLYLNQLINPKTQQEFKPNNLTFCNSWKNAFENIMRKGENTGYHKFLIFPLCFYEGFLHRVIRNQDLLIKLYMSMLLTTEFWTCPVQFESMCRRQNRCDSRNKICPL